MINNKISLKLISMEDILQATKIDYKEILDVIKKSLLDYKNGEIILPDKISQIVDEESQSRINCMPATVRNVGVCGVKWVSVFPDNPFVYNCPNVSGVIILSDIKTGYPFAIMDGTLITALRTACMGGLAASYLAGKEPKVYCSIGSGEQAKIHFKVMKELFPSVEKCYVASRHHESEMSFVTDLKDHYPDVSFVCCDSDYEKASSEADLIVTAVSCQLPLLKSKAIKKGAFYCHVGGYEDEYTVPQKADKIICDNWGALKHRGSPTIARMYSEGILKDEDIYCDLVDIIDGSKPGRVSEDEFIYFNSIGLSFVDVAVAQYFYEKTQIKNIGTDWNLKSTDISMSL